MLRKFAGGTRHSPGSEKSLAACEGFDIVSLVHINNRKRSHDDVAKRLLCLLLVLMASAPWLPRRNGLNLLSGSGWKLWCDKAAAWEHDLYPSAGESFRVAGESAGRWVGRFDIEWHLCVGAGNGGGIFDAGHRAGGRLQRCELVVALDSISLKMRARTSRCISNRSVNVRRSYLDHQLVGYDVIGGTPFEVDLTGKVKPGQNCELAVRITDPGGNYDWRDSSAFYWGENKMPMSHAFGGITGRVYSRDDPVYVDDIYVQNEPSITNATAFVTVQNTSTKSVTQPPRDVTVEVTGKPFPEMQKHIPSKGVSHESYRCTARTGS